jgi:cell wall-associated NlpC family hydrolase
MNMIKPSQKISGFLLLAVIFVFFSASVSAMADQTYIVRKGDSLYRISKKYKIDTGTIAKANNLVSDALMPGTKLLIPSSDADKDSTAADVKSRKGVPGETSSHDLLTAKTGSLKEEPRTYKVRKGDSLWKIGKKYSVSVRELKKLNSLKSSRLKPAQELVLFEPRIPEVRSGMDIVSLMQSQTNQDAGIEPAETNGTLEPKHTTAEEFFTFVARQTLGIPYKFGSNSMKATDCSGYVQRVFSFMGIQLPRSAREQFNLGLTVEKRDLSIGDLVFFRTYAPFPSHVGIYLGDNLFVHASALARKVTIDNINTPYYIKRFIGAKRLFGFNDNLTGSSISGTDPQ